MHLIYEALKKTNGSTDGDALIAAMKGMAWESPRGPISIDPRRATSCRTSTSARSRRWTASSTTSSSRPFEASRTRSRPRRSSAAYRRPTAARRLSPRTERAAAWRHADHPLRRHRLRHAAVRAGLRAGRDAGADELRQPGARRLRHGRRLHHRAPDEPLGVPFLACLPIAFLGRGGARRGAGAHALRPHVRPQPTWTRCCSRSAWCSWRWPRSTTSWARAAERQLPAWLQGRFDDPRRRHRPLPLASSSWSAARWRSALQSLLSRTRFGSRLRAAVDDPRVARGLGINVGTRLRA